MALVSTGTRPVTLTLPPHVSLHHEGNRIHGTKLQNHNHWIRLLLMGSFPMHQVSGHRLVFVLSHFFHLRIQEVLLSLFWSWETMLRELKQLIKDFIRKWPSRDSTCSVLAPLFFTSCHAVFLPVDTTALHCSASAIPSTPSASPLCAIPSQNLHDVFASLSHNLPSLLSS